LAAYQEERAFHRWMDSRKDMLFTKTSEDTTKTMVAHDILMKTLVENQYVWRAVDKVLRHLKRPTFIPMFAMDVNPTHIHQSATIDYEATALVNLCQILKFAPNAAQRDGEILKYSLDPTDLEGRRFPTRNDPAGLYDGERKTDGLLGGRFSLDDMNRAAVLGGMCYVRRNKPKEGSHILNQSRPRVRATKEPFHGWIDPPRYRAGEKAARMDQNNTSSAWTEAQIKASLNRQDARQEAAESTTSIDGRTGPPARKYPCYALQEVETEQADPVSFNTRMDLWDHLMHASSGSNPGETMDEFFKSHAVDGMDSLTNAAYQVIVEEARRNQFEFDYEKAKAEIDETLTDFSALVDSTIIQNFLTESLKHPIIKNLLEKPSMTEQKLTDLLSRDFILDKLMSDLGEEPDVDWEKYREVHALSEYPDWQPFRSGHQTPFKLHQFASKFFSP
jgi:hypothetical protein